MKKESPELKKYRSFVRNIASICQRVMFLNLYTIDIEYPQASKKEKRDDGNSCVAEIYTNHRYYSACITLYPETFQRWKRKGKRSVADAIVHEFCHIITDPLYKRAYQTSNNENADFLEDLREQTTQHIANIVMAYLEDCKDVKFD